VLRHLVQTLLQLIECPENIPADRVSEADRDILEPVDFLQRKASIRESLRASRDRFRPRGRRQCSGWSWEARISKLPPRNQMNFSKRIATGRDPLPRLQAPIRILVILSGNESPDCRRHPNG